LGGQLQRGRAGSLPKIVAVAELLAVPNVSEGRDPDRIRRLARAFDAHLLDTHSDPDHHRTVFTLSGEPGRLSAAVLAGAAEAIRQIDLSAHDGVHPRVGAIDVAPIVYPDDRDRGAACAEALVLADRLGHELDLPVFLYGELTQFTRTRADLRRGGPQNLAARVAAGELTPDFGPLRLHPTAGAVLVAARPPLVAFNVELAAPATEQVAKEIAARIRQGGAEGLPSVRAIGLWLAHRELAQVSVNVDDHRQTTLAEIISAIARHATPVRAELVGLAPRAAFEGFPEDLPVANRRYLEDATKVAVRDGSDEAQTAQ
jgi:glutamate formiminotransferase / 5-formyltetrahydrofolate cyclo-ligase